MNDDFWKFNLPNNLATSASKGPALFAYYAALVILDAKALYSDIKISDLLDPSYKSTKSAAEKHHIFPINYLKSIGITDSSYINQIANSTLVEWSENILISDKSPKEYISLYEDKFPEQEIARMYNSHAMPEKWHEMDYQEFLQKRRELMALVIKNGYDRLCPDYTEYVHMVSIPVEDLLSNGESGSVEFKATLRTNLHTNNIDQRMEFAVLRTISGFLNTHGGNLLIGVNNDGTLNGLESDKFLNEDKMGLHLVNLIKTRIGLTAMEYIHLRFEDYDGGRIMVVECKPSKKPIFLKDSNLERFFIRTGPSSSELSGSDIMDYSNNHWK